MDEQISQFSAVTGADADRARFFVESSNGDVEAAVATYFESGGASGAEASEDASASATASSSAPAPQPAATPQASAAAGGPRTLSGAPAEPLSSSGWGSQAATNSGSRKSGAGFSASGGSRGGGIATLRDYRSDDRAPGRGASSDDGEEDDRKDPENLYAGGERSGLSVQNPNMGRGRGQQPDAVKQILEQARRAGMRGGSADDEDDDDEEQGRGSGSGSRGQSNLPPLFSGAGRTIGDAGAPSEADSASSAAAGGGGVNSSDEVEEDVPEEVQRTLTFWADGFSIQDGPLRPYDDEESKRILEMIKSGTAPLSLFNVRFGQRVSIGVAHRTDEKYTPPPPPPMQPFGGSGNRLGSPAPSMSSTSTSAPAAAPASSSSTANAATSSPVTVDDSQPVTSLQIRLGDGSRLAGRFNHSHTVADVRSFINSSSSSTSGERSYTLHTSFPPKLISDEAQSIKDAGLISAVVIQKWA